MKIYSNITIKAEISPASDIVEAFKNAIRISRILWCYVEFDFNGVTCFAAPDGDEETGAKNYRNALKQNGHSFAHSRP